MREFIFRGKRKDFDNEWLYGFYTLYNNNRGMKPTIITGTEENCCILLEVIDETIGQFTGSYDVNGNKIFEHDIVKKVVNDEELIGVVEYADAAFGVRFADGEGQFLCFFENCCEIIGNVYDNPELIKM